MNPTERHAQLLVETEAMLTRLKSETVPPAPAALGDIAGAPAQPDSTTATAAGAGVPATDATPAAEVEGDQLTREIAALEREVARREIGALALEGTAEAVSAIVKGAGHSIEVGDETTIVFADGRKASLSRESLAAAGVPMQLIRAAGVGGSDSRTTGIEATSEITNVLGSQKAWDAMPKRQREALLRKVFS